MDARITGPVEQVAGRKLRKRIVETCLDEIVEVKRSHPNLELLVITDDCTTADIQRFKRFLVCVVEMDLGWDLSIDNVRANLIDEELIDLFVAAGGSSPLFSPPPTCPGGSRYCEGLRGGEECGLSVPATRLADELTNLGHDRVQWFKADSQGTDLRIFMMLPELIRAGEIAVRAHDHPASTSVSTRQSSVPRGSAASPPVSFRPQTALSHRETHHNQRNKMGC